MNNTQSSFGLRSGSRASTRQMHENPILEEISIDNNPMFNEMKYRLNIYKEEQIKSIKENKRIENDNFKKNFYTSLENLLNQISNLRDKKLKASKIEVVFKWFKVKMTFFNDLNTITKRTDKNVYENYPNLDTNVKSDYYEAGNYPTNFERDHRTEDEGLMPPKDRYNIIYH